MTALLEKLCNEFMTDLPKVIPAVFPPLFGFVALGMLWQVQGLIMAGWVAAAIWLVFALAYVSRILKDQSVIRRDLDTLPGRTGTVAANLTLMLVAAQVSQVSTLLAALLLATSLLIQAALILAFLARVRRERHVVRDQQDDESGPGEIQQGHDGAHMEEGHEHRRDPGHAVGPVRLSARHRCRATRPSNSACR
jgi:hypothetical protein